MRRVGAVCSYEQGGVVQGVGGVEVVWERQADRVFDPCLHQQT